MYIYIYLHKVLLSNQGSQLKSELNKCTIGVDLPSGHALRSQLDDQKEKLETLLDLFLGLFGTDNRFLSSQKHIEYQFHPI